MQYSRVAVPNLNLTKLSVASWFQSGVLNVLQQFYSVKTMQAFFFFLELRLQPKMELADTVVAEQSIVYLTNSDSLVPLDPHHSMSSKVIS